jgi:hypothetical protein
LASLGGVGQFGVLVGFRQVLQPTLAGKPRVQALPIFLWAVLRLICGPPVRGRSDKLGMQRRVRGELLVLRPGFAATLPPPVGVP